MAFGGEQLDRYVVVQVDTDEGISGLLLQSGGDRGRYFGESPATTVFIVTEVIARAVKGLDPLHREAVHRRIDQTIKGYPYAKCAVDLALHDIAGKAFGMPVYQAARRPVPARALDIMRQEATAAVEDGVGTIKVTIGLDPEHDVEAVKEVRHTVGDGIDIVVDANQGYPTPKVAIQTLKRLSEYRIRYAEQPVEGLYAMARAASKPQVSTDLVSCST